MSRYIVRIVGPAGRETYLYRGREVECLENATHYSHPSSARTAAEVYRRKQTGFGPRVHADILDARDPERQV